MHSIFVKLLIAYKRTENIFFNSGKKLEIFKSIINLVNIIRILFIVDLINFNELSL